jgi:hypothetical protein
MGLGFCDADVTQFLPTLPKLTSVTVNTGTIRVVGTSVIGSRALVFTSSDERCPRSNTILISEMEPGTKAKNCQKIPKRMFARVYLWNSAEAARKLSAWS